MNVSKNLSAIIAVIMVVSMVAVGATAVGAVGTQSAVEDTTLSTSEEVGVTGALTDSFRSSGAQSTPELDSQSAQVADQLKGASGETTVLLKVDRNIQVEGSLPSEFSSEELEQDSEATLQPVVDSVNSLPNAEVTQRIVIGNALVVEIDLDQHDIDQLATIPGVEAVAPNIKFEHPAQLDESTGAVSPSDVTVPDPDAEYTWGLQQIGIPSFDEQFDVRGEGANVTIIDDGISDGDHPDLEFAQKVNIVDNEINVGAIGVTDNAHGEHVAGTATGALDPAGDVPRYGVAPNASLTKINVFEGTPGASFANILTAVDYAVTERNADVAGLSLGAGGPVSTVASIVDAQMREAKTAGTLVTVSAGNGGDFFQGGDEGAPVSTPATEFDAFSVGASADQPAVINTTEAFPPSIPSSIAAFTGSNNDITQFSSGAIVSDRRSLDLLEGTVGVGDFYPDDYPRQYVQPDVAAPGLFVLSSGPLGNDAGAPGVNATSDGYSWTQGTSMAQPHVAGAVALIQSATEEELGPQEISAALTETAEKPDNASEKFPSIGERDIRYGAGIINVTAAALAAQNMTEATGTVTDDAGEPVTGASLETEEGALVRTIDGEYSLASTESTPNVTVNAYGFDPVTEELTSDDQTFTLDRDLTVTEVVQGQPGTTESGGEFTIVADVASVETFTLELSDSSSFQVGVDERDLTASIAGVGEIPFGQPVSLGNFTGLAEITVSISETADVATGDQLLLDHTFEGSGESVSVTTGPTTLVDAAGAVSSVSIDADFIGTINDQPTTTVTAEGILKDGEPSDGDRLTFTIGGEPVATNVTSGGVATAEVNAEALDLGPQEDVTVDVLEFEAAQTDTVDIVDEVADLEEGFNLLSVPQPATLTTQDVSSLNVWDSEDETYDAVTSPEFDTASDLHDGLYVDASSDNARLGFTFNEDVPVGGTQDVNTDWNLLGANFPLDSEDIGTSTTIENDLTGVDADALELFRGDFSEFLTPNSQVGPFEAYWAFNPATSADERGIASPSYDEGNRRDVLGQGESDFQPNITNIETTSVEDADDEITLDDRDVVGASEQVVLVDVTVENNGNGTDVQFVTLEVAPQVGPGSSFELADQTGIELGPGESGNVTLAFVASQDDVSPIPSFVPDDVAIEVTTEDGDAEDVGIPFDDGGITVEDQALSTGGEFGVENVDVAGHGTVQLVDANDNVLDSVEFAQGINEEVTFTVDDPANVTDDVTVRVLDDNELEELTSETVDVLDTRFTVSNNAPEFALVNETVDVPVTVTSNVAVPEDDVSVNFSVGGTDAGSQTVDLGAFESETVSFPVNTTGLSVGDTVEHTATSPDDSDTRTLTITETSLSFSDQALSAVSDGASDGGDGGNDSGTTSGAPDVVITLDVSGSMGSPPSKLANAKAGAKDLVNRLSEDASIGLVAFESDVTVAQELTTDKTQVRQAIDSLVSGGQTNMSGGINESQALLEQQSDADTDDVMVVLGNGGANVVGDQATINAALDARNASNVSAVGDGTTLISIAYGSGADVTLMEQISSPPKVIDGVINESDENAFDSDQDDIDQVFQDIGESIAGDQQVLVEDVTARPGQSVVITDTNFTVKGAVDVANITNSSDGINDRNVLVPVNNVDAGDHIAHVVEDTSDVSASGPGLVNEQATLAAVGIQPIENKSIAEESLPNDVVESVTVDVDAGDRNETFTVEIDRGGTVLGNATTSADAESVTVTLDEPVTKDDTANETVALDATLIGADDAEFDRADETAQFQPFSDRERFTISVGEADASVSLPDQALGSANVSGQDQPAVVVEDVTGSAGQFVVITNASAPFDILGSVELEDRAAGDSFTVPLDVGAEGGNFRAHLTSDAGLLGDDDALVTDEGRVFEPASVSISNQSFVGTTDQITVDSSNLQADGAANYRIVVHDQTGVPAGGVGPALGVSDVLTGSESNTTIELGSEITSTQDVLVMIHFESGSPPIPVLNNDAFSISDGQAGTITDTATVTIDPTPANYQLSNLTPADAVVEPAESFDVSATVDNTGDLAGTQTIELAVGGEVVASEETVELAGGENTTVTFENVSVDTVGEFTHTVASANDSVSGSLSVVTEQVTFDDQSLTADGEVLVTDVTTTTADQQVVITNSNFTIVGQTGDLGVVVQENILINVSGTTPGDHIAHIVTNASNADGGPGLVTDQATVATVAIDEISNKTIAEESLPNTVTDEVTVNVDAGAQSETFTVEIANEAGDVIGTATTDTNGAVTVSLDEPVIKNDTATETVVLDTTLVGADGADFDQPRPDANDGFQPFSDQESFEVTVTDAAANVVLPDQALGTANESAAVQVQDVTGQAGQFVVITNASAPFDILGSVELEDRAAGDSFTVPLDVGAEGGEFRAHLTNDVGLLGDGDDGALVTDAGTVFEPASVSISNQSFVGTTDQITVDSSNLQADGAANYRIVVHNQTGVPAGGVGPALGDKDNISGNETNVTLDLFESLTTTTDVLVMIHFPGASPIPVVNDDAFGISDGQAGTITDTATVTIDPVSSEQVTFDDQSLTNDGEVLVENVTTASPDQQVVITDSDFNVVGQTGDLDGIVVQENFLIDVNTTAGDHIAHIVSNASEADGGPGLVTDRATVVDAEVSVDDVSVSDTDDNTPVTVGNITVQTADVAAATQTNFTVEIEDDTGDVIGNATGLTGTNDNVNVSLDQPIEATSVGEVTEQITAVLVDENGSAFNIAQTQPADGLARVSDDATLTITVNEAGASVSLNDQAVGTANGSDALRTEDVTGEAGQFVVITPADNTTILGSTELNQSVAGEQVDVELDQQISGGEFRAHLTTSTGLLGTGDALVTDTGTVFEPASISISDQTFVGSTSNITVASSNLQADGPAEYRIVVHDQTRANSGPAPSDVGPGIGSEGNLTGNESDVQINLDEEITSTQDVLVMIHFPDGGAAIPVLNGSAFGFGDGQAGTITDTATITSIESSQTFEDQVLTNNTADRGDSEVLVEDVRTNQSSDVLVTAGPDVTGTIVGIESVPANTSGQDLNISIDDRTGFPGAHTVHVVTGGVSNSEGVGDTVSNATEANITSSDTATVFDASVNLTDQAFEDSTDQITVNSSDLQADGAAQYRIVVHDQTQADNGSVGPPPSDVGPALGFSGVLNGTESNVTIDLNKEITSTQDVLVMIHFPNVGESSPGAAIPVLNGSAFGFGDGQNGTVTDTATIEIEQAVNGSVTFSDQAFSSDGNVTVENVQSTDLETVGGNDTGVNAFDPQDDFLVLTDGTSVNDGSEGVIDAVQLSEFTDGNNVALNASGVAAGEFTVVLHEPNATGDAPDASAPRTNASSGEVVNATATVFNGSVTVETEELNEEEEPLDEIDVSASLVGATEFAVNVTGDATGNVTGLSRAGTFTVQLNQELTDGETVNATIERNGSAVQQATSAAGFQDLADDNDITVIAANFQLSNLNISGQGADAAVDAGASPSDVGFTVENTGGAAAQATVDLNITDNSTGASVITDNQTTVTLSNGDSLTTAFRDVDLGGLDPGNYTVEVNTDDDTVTGSLTVNGTNLNVSALNIADQGDNATIREDEDFAVNATVDNLGNAGGTQDIVLNITNAAGNDVANASETITVTGGSSDTVNFTGLNVDVGITAEDFSVSVSSENTTATGDLRVNPLNVGVDITDVDVTNNEIEIGDGPTPVDVTIENLADQELTRTVTVEVVDNETGPTGVTASANQTLRSGDTLGTTLDLATGTLDQGNYTINATTETDEDSVAFDVNFANVSNLDQTEGFDTLDAALGNLNDGDELRIGDVTLDNEPTDVTLSNNNVRVFGQGTGATTVQTNLTVTGDNNVIEALTLEGNFTDSGTNNTISGANVTSASPGGFVFIEAGADATINNTAAENVVIDQDADASIQQQSSVSGTLTNNGTADISNTTAGTVENNGNATVSDSDVDSVTGTGDLTIQNPSPGAGEVFVDNVTTTDTIVETFDSIQEANDNAGVDANLTLGSGTFSEKVTVDVTGVTIESADDVTSTVSASSGTVFTVTADNVTIDGVTIEANSGSTGVDAGGATDLVLQNNNFETDSSGTVYVTGESGLVSDPSTVRGNNNFDPSAVVEAGEIVVEQTDVQIDSAEFDDGNSENDSVTILGSFLNTATELIGSIVVGFGNITGNVGLGNVGLGNVDVGNVEVGDQEFNVGNVDVGNNGELNISLDENIDLSDVDNEAEINITIDDIDTTDADVDNGNVSVDFEDTDGNSVAQNETNSSTAPSISIGT